MTLTLTLTLTKCGSPAIYLIQLKPALVIGQLQVNDGIDSGVRRGSASRHCPICRAVQAAASWNTEADWMSWGLTMAVVGKVRLSATLVSAS